jgi:hypothetical protein
MWTLCRSEPRWANTGTRVPIPISPLCAIRSLELGVNVSLGGFMLGHLSFGFGALGRIL